MLDLKNAALVGIDLFEGDATYKSMTVLSKFAVLSGAQKSCSLLAGCDGLHAILSALDLVEDGRFTHFDTSTGLTLNKAVTDADEAMTLG